MYNAARGQNGSLAGGAGFNKLAAGRKQYGTGRRAPNVGKTSNITGYGERDLRNEAKRNALTRWAGRK